VIILGIDTATDRVSCAIGGAEGVLAELQVTRGRRHTETLVPAIQFACERAGFTLKEVSVVAVDIGPGLYTGMRVGIATAKAIAQAVRAPMIGHTSLDLIAFPMRWTDRVVASVIDARRGEVFWALYRRVPGGVQRLTEPCVSKADELAAELLAMGEDVIAVGDGALKYADILSDVGQVEIAGPTFAYPTAGALVELVHPRAIREEWVQPWEIRPLYLRDADAQPNWVERPPL
jgi:tRNA threonylcarbamoyladenosine biosynthesis protein TsaB